MHVGLKKLKLPYIYTGHKAARQWVTGFIGLGIMWTSFEILLKVFRAFALSPFKVYLILSYNEALSVY